MKRHGDLFARLVSFKSLLGAAQAARRGKRFKPNVARLDFDVEQELLALRQELLTQTFGPVPTAPSLSANRRWLTESSSSWMSMS